MTISGTLAALTITLLLATTACRRPAVLPPPVFVSGDRLDGAFKPSSLVATGRLTGIKGIGGPVQVPGALAYPCEALFWPSRFIKGRMKEFSARFLWYSFSSDCAMPPRIKHHKPAVESVWFLRRDKAWLRPLWDVACPRLELFQPIDGPDNEQDTRRTLARMVLTPDAVSESSSEYIRSSLNYLELAEDLVGDQSRAELLSALQPRTPPEIRAEFCRYFAGSYDECSFADCPSGFLFSGLTGDKAVSSQEVLTAGEMTLTSKEHVERNLRAANEIQRAGTLAELQRFSCSYKAMIRERARQLVRQYFPSAPQTVCVPCR
jgi:hypothetical protein